MLENLALYGLILVGAFLVFCGGIQISNKTRGLGLVMIIGCLISAVVGLYLPLVIALNLKLDISVTWALTGFARVLITALYGFMYFGGYFLVGLFNAAGNSS